MSAVSCGDATALAALFDRHKPMLFSLCLRTIRDRSEAEQVLLDVFMEVWQRPERFDPTRGSPILYLIMLVRSRAIDQRRSSNTRLRHSSPSASSPGEDTAAPSPGGPLEGLVAGEVGLRLRQAMSGLEDKQREAIELAFFDGLTHREIARRLNKPLGTVKTFIRAGLIRLRDRLRTEERS